VSLVNVIGYAWVVPAWTGLETPYKVARLIDPHQKRYIGKMYSTKLYYEEKPSGSISVKIMFDRVENSYEGSFSLYLMGTRVRRLRHTLPGVEEGHLEALEAFAGWFKEELKTPEFAKTWLGQVAQGGVLP